MAERTAHGVQRLHLYLKAITSLFALSEALFKRSAPIAKRSYNEVLIEERSAPQAQRSRMYEVSIV